MVEILQIQASDPTLPPNINKGHFDIVQTVCCLLTMHTFAAGACSWSCLVVRAHERTDSPLMAGADTLAIYSSDVAKID